MAAPTLVSELSTQIFSSIQAEAGKVLYFSVRPAMYWQATRSGKPDSPIPLITAHGDRDDLGLMLSAFQHWDGPITVAGHCSDGLCEFWVEN